MSLRGRAPLFEPGLRRTGVVDLSRLRGSAEQESVTPFVLPTTGVVDGATFFDAVRASLPLDPPIVGSQSWDALSDSLFEGLLSCPHHRIAIIWQGTQVMAASAAADFEIALAVFADVAALLADPEVTGGATKQLAVLVE